MKDQKIIGGIRNRDEAAVSQAMDQYARLVWHIAATVLKNVAAAEDIEECVADVFVYLWQNPDQYDEGRGTLKSWLSVVAKSKAIDKYRQLSKINEVSLSDEAFRETLGTIDDTLSMESRRELVAAINTLSMPDREIIIRRYYYRQKPKEISFCLDIPVKQVENRLYRSKLKLRQQMGGASYESL